MSDLEKQDSRALGLVGNLKWLWRRGFFGTLKHLSHKGMSDVSRVLRSYIHVIRMNYTNKQFDRRFGIETWRGILTKEMTGSGENTEHSEIYAPLPEKTFHHVMNHKLDVDFEDYTFVDYGSGKGKVLLMASDYPFKKIIGVEFAENLHEVAAENVKRYKNKRQRCFDVEPMLGDACEFELPEGNCLLFFFAPFFGPVLNQVLENIKTSMAENPRRIIICYMDDHVPHSMLWKMADPIQEWGLFDRYVMKDLPFDPGAAIPLAGTVWQGK